MKNIILSFSLLLSISLVATITVANESDSPTEEVTVFGSRLSATDNTVAYTIKQNSIELTNPLTLTELLSSMPGVTSIEPGGPAGVAEVYIRGADANFTTVYVDGVRMNDPTDSRGGAFDFSSIAPGEVQKLEIVKGPYSAIYGSGAVAGAINIETIPSASLDTVTKAHVSSGSDGYWQTGGQVTGAVGPGFGSISINHLDYGDPMQDTSRIITSAAANFSADFSESLNGSFAIRGSDGERRSFPIASGGELYSATTDTEFAATENISASATLRWDTSKINVTSGFSFFQREEQLSTPPIASGVFDAVPASSSLSQLGRYGAFLKIRTKMNKKVELVAGIDYESEEGDASGALDLGAFMVPTGFDKHRTTVSPFLEGRLKLGSAVSVFGGFRYDDFSDGNSGLSPRLGLRFQQTPDGASLTGSWGSARKAPSFYALADQLVGNPQLKHEESDGIDFKLTWPLVSKNLNLSFSAYQYEYQDLIDFDFTSFSLVNRSSVEVDGYEVSLSGNKSPAIHWKIFVTAQDNYVDGVKNGLLHRPETSAGASLRWDTAKQWTVNLNGRYSSERQSSSVPTGFVRLDSYSVFNVALTKPLGSKIKLRFSINNLFDKSYQAVVGFLAPDRQLRIGLSYSG